MANITIIYSIALKKVVIAIPKQLITKKAPTNIGFGNKYTNNPVNIINSIICAIKNFSVFIIQI